MHTNVVISWHVLRSRDASASTSQDMHFTAPIFSAHTPCTDILHTISQSLHHVVPKFSMQTPRINIFHAPSTLHHTKSIPSARKSFLHLANFFILSSHDHHENARLTNFMLISNPYNSSVEPDSLIPLCNIPRYHQPKKISPIS
jgi:hypothetical protein